MAYASPEVIELAECGSTKHTIAPNKAVHADLMVPAAAKMRLGISCDANKRRHWFASETITGSLIGRRLREMKQKLPL